MDLKELEYQYQRALREFTYMGESIPGYMHEGIVNYLTQGVPSGSFLMAVLSNDFSGACRAADMTNMTLMHVYHAFLYQKAPAGSWGSVDKVSQWIAARGEHAEEPKQ
jgi:hypothetical protein